MKVLFYILLGYLLYKILKGRLGQKGRMQGGRGRGAPEPPRPVRQEEEMVQDPVCKSYVPMSEALKERTRQGVVYFCGTECREKYHDRKETGD